MNDDIRWKQRLNNHTKALALLNKIALKETPWDETHNLACIQAFEMVLELAWNLLKDYMQDQGLSFQPTPKDTIREAYNKNYIKNGQVWLDAIKDRNLTSHTYNEDVASALIDNIRHKYLPAFKALQTTFVRLSEESHE